MYKRDYELYKNHKVLESVQLFVFVTDTIDSNHKMPQLISTIHGLIDNNAEWCHVNLVKSQELLSKYAASTKATEHKWGFGSSRVEQK